MKLYLLDKSFQAVKPIDQYESIIWTDRYNEFGDFELYIPIELCDPKDFVLGFYLKSNMSEHVMVIDRKRIEDDPENGTHLIVTGKSLEALLNRRVMFDDHLLCGSLDAGLNGLVNLCMVYPVMSVRRVPCMGLKFSNDPEIIKLNIVYFCERGENLYNLVQKICSAYDIGFKLILTENDLLEFSIYKGTDRSYEQTINDYVVCSSEFHTLLSGVREQTDENYKNAAFIFGDGYNTTAGDDVSGLERRETVIDASELEYDTEDPMFNPELYMQSLKSFANSEMADCAVYNSFEFDIDVQNGQFIFGKDFFLGDEIQVVFHNETASIRIMEVTFSEDASGLSVSAKTMMKDQVKWEEVKIK